MTTSNVDGEQFAVVTNVGRTKLNLLAAGERLVIASIAFGDGNGVAVVPDADGVSLAREIGREAITEQSSEYLAAGVFMSSAMADKYKGQWLREVGLVDSDGDLIVWGAMAPTLVSVFSERTIMVHLPLSDSDKITVLVDTSKKYASADDVTKAINAHVESDNAHKAIAIGFEAGKSGLEASSVQAAILELAEKIKHAGGNSTVDLTEQSAQIANLASETHATLPTRCTLTTSAGELTVIADGAGRPMYEPIPSATYQLIIETDRAANYFNQKLTIIDLDSDDTRSNFVYVRSGRSFDDAKIIGWSPLVGLPAGDLYVDGFIRTAHDVVLIELSQRN